MAFVYQKLTEEDKKCLNSFKIPFQYGNAGLTFARKETPVDRERNIYLYYVEGLREMEFKDEKPPAVYYLIWDGDLVKFACYMEDRKRDENIDLYIILIYLQFMHQRNLKQYKKN